METQGDGDWERIRVSCYFRGEHNPFHLLVGQNPDSDVLFIATSPDVK